MTRLRPLRLALLLAFATVAPACADFDAGEVVSACCDCLVDNGCTSVSRDECGEVVAGAKQSLPVSAACVQSHGCSPICADAGFTWK